MTTTVLIEPDSGGHRFQAVANVAREAARTGPVRLLTSHGASGSAEFDAYLSGADIEVSEVFDHIYPSTAQMLAQLTAACRRDPVGTVVVMDADQTLKRWFYLAPRAFRGVSKPRVVFMLTRYPARMRAWDRTGWKLRSTKALLALAAMATGSLHRVAGFAGRDDTSPGWIVKRARDPDVCSAHSRDRSELRTALGLPHDRRLAGIFGVITERKHAPMILTATEMVDDDTDLVLAGALADEVRAWLEALPAERRRRVIVHDEFLTNETLDQMVAAVDVVPIALTNNGPSGIMGKALAAGVPVVSAGSEVRARELVATDAGELADLDAPDIAEAMRRALERDPSLPRRSTVPPATPEEFARRVLGVPLREHDAATAPHEHS